jgi:uncharacterized protein DUF6967
MTEPLETVTDIGELEIPYSRHLRLQNVDFHNGFNMMRMIWREGRRLTIVNIDAETATKLGNELLKWAKDNPPAN